MEPAKNPLKLQAGGTVREGSIYLPRRADEELFERLAKGEPCHVLAPRQIGKSSLRLRTMRRLEQSGRRAVAIDLTNTVGSTGITPLDWLYAVAWQIQKQAKPKADFKATWNEDASLPGRLRWCRFLRETLAHGVDKPLVVFVEEIDVALALPFPPDDFFVGLHQLVDSRADDPALDRVTFCLIGVASPEQLMSDGRLTPLDISHPIELRDFTRQEIEPLGLVYGGGAESGRILDEVYGWTSGHPYMTQRICLELCQRGPRDTDVTAFVQRLVKEVFLDAGRVEDPNLHYADRYLGKDNREAPVLDMLHVYRKLLQGKRIVADSGDRVQLHLQMSGVAAIRSDGRERVLVPRNRVFEQVFDLPWVAEREAEIGLLASVSQWLNASPEQRSSTLLSPEKLNRLASPTTADFKELQSLLASRQGLEYLTASEQEGRRAAELQAIENAAREKQALQRELYQAQKAKYQWAIIGLLLLLLGAGGVQWFQRRRAIDEANDAKHQAEEKAIEAKTAESRETRRRLAARASEAAGDGREADALAWALGAAVFNGLEDDDPSEAVESLGRALSAANASFPLQLDGPVVSVAFSTKRKDERLLTAGGTAVRLWDPKTAKAAGGFGPMSKKDDQIKWAGFTPDESGANILFESGRLRRLGFEDLASTEIEVPGRPSRGRVIDLAATPDGLHLAVVRRGDDGATTLEALGFDSPDKPASRSVQVTTDVDDIAVAPDGARVLLVTPLGDVEVWNVAGDGKMDKPHSASCGAAENENDATKKQDGGQSQKRHGLSISPDGGYVTCFFGDSFTLWDASFRSVLHDSVRADEVDDGIGPAQREIRSATVAAPPLGDDKSSPLLVLGMKSGQITTRWVQEKPLRAALPRPRIVSTHHGAVTSVVLAPSRERFVTAAADGSLDVHVRRRPTYPDWDHVSLARYRGQVVGTAFSASGDALVTGHEDGTIRLWRFGSSWLGHHGGAITAMSVGDDGRRAATGSYDGTAKIWALDDPTRSRTILPDPDRSRPVYSVSLSPFGGTDVLTDGKPYARIWDTETGELLAKLETPEDEFTTSASYSADGQRILTKSLFGPTRVWRSDGSPVEGFPVPGPRQALKLSEDSQVSMMSPDGAHFMTFERNEVKLWSADTGKLCVTLDGHEQRVSSFDWSDDGQTILTASEDRTAALWSVSKCLSGGCKDTSRCSPDVRFVGSQSALNGAALSPDGALVATAGDDGTLRLWSRNGEQIAQENAHTTALYVMFSRDGRRLLTFGRDNVVHVWQLDPSDTDYRLASVTKLPSTVPISFARLLPDGMRAVSAYDDGYVKLDPTTPEGLVETACELLGGSLDWYAQQAPDLPASDTVSTRATRQDWRRVKEICQKPQP